MVRWIAAGERVGFLGFDDVDVESTEAVYSSWLNFGECNAVALLQFLDEPIIENATYG